jgi:hypothetical protein
MGLTIHYSLSLPAKTTVQEVRQRLGTLRQACLDIPFQEVGAVLVRNTRRVRFLLAASYPYQELLCDGGGAVGKRVAATGAVPGAGNNGGWGACLYRRRKTSPNRPPHHSSAPHRSKVIE